MKPRERSESPGGSRRIAESHAAERTRTPALPAAALAASIEAAGARVRPGSGGANVLTPATILRLQRSAGNRGVVTLLEGVRASGRRPGLRRAPDGPGKGRGRRVVQRDFLDDVGDAVSETVGSVADTASEAASEGRDAVSTGAGAVADTASEAANDVADVASGVAGTVADTAGEVVDDVADVASDVAGTVADTAGEALDTVTETVSDVGDAIAGGAEAAWDEVTGLASDAVDGVADIAGDAWDRLADTARSAASGASQIAGDVWNAVADGAEQVWNGISGLASSAWDTVSDAASGAWETVKGTASDIADGVRDLAVDAWNGIKSAAGAAWDAVSGGIRSLWDSLGNGVARALKRLAEVVPLPGSDVRSRALSSGERAYAQEIFGDTIDYDPIVITRGSVMSVGSARATGNAVNLEDRDFVGDTMELSGVGYTTLIHEMTHVLQFQHGGLGYIPESLWEQFKAWKKTGKRDAAYDWQTPDAAGIPWEDWKVEQQAQAVEDYNVELRKMERGEKYNAALLARLQRYVEHMRAGPRA